MGEGGPALMDHSDGSHIFVWKAGCVCVNHLSEKRMEPERTMGKMVSWWRQCDAQGDVLLGNCGS